MATLHLHIAPKHLQVREKGRSALAQLLRAEGGLNVDLVTGELACIDGCFALRAIAPHDDDAASVGVADEAIDLRVATTPDALRGLLFYIDASGGGACSAQDSMAAAADAARRVAVCGVRAQRIRGVQRVRIMLEVGQLGVVPSN